MEKKEIRKRCLEARQGLSQEDVARESEAVAHRLRTLPAFETARVILCYVSSKDNEVDTHLLIGRLIRDKKRVLVPVAKPKGALVWSELHGLEELAPGRFGILEPRAECLRIVEPPQDGVVIVPGIAFSTDCRRIGYGGGYFDRFLATYPGLSIGLAFDVQIADDWVSEPHDVPLNFVVTESRIYSRA